MKVYLELKGERRLIGHADIKDDGQPAHRVLLFGDDAPSVVDVFPIVELVVPPADGGWSIERVLIVQPMQRPEVLPGWRPAP